MCGFWELVEASASDSEAPSFKCPFPLGAGFEPTFVSIDRWPPSNTAATDHLRQHFHNYMNGHGVNF
jgi:hypothetical protein